MVVLNHEDSASSRIRLISFYILRFLHRHQSALEMMSFVEIIRFEMRHFLRELERGVQRDFVERLRGIVRPVDEISAAVGEDLQELTHPSRTRKRTSLWS